MLEAKTGNRLRNKIWDDKTHKDGQWYLLQDPQRGQWYLLLELLVSGTVRRSHISRLEERPQLADDHFSPITASSLESFITVFESVRVQRAQNLASKEAGFFSFC